MKEGIFLSLFNKNKRKIEDLEKENENLQKQIKDKEEALQKERDFSSIERYRLNKELNEKKVELYNLKEQNDKIRKNIIYLNKENESLKLRYQETPTLSGAILYEPSFDNNSQQLKDNLEKRIKELVDKANTLKNEKNTSQDEIDKKWNEIKGLAGEKNTLHFISLLDIPAYYLYDVRLESKDSYSAQIDFLIITKKLIFVIEVKYCNAEEVNINEIGTFFRRGNDYNGDNPCGQNDRHKMVIKKILEEEDLKKCSDILQPLEVICGKKGKKLNLDISSAPKEIRERVFKADELVFQIKEKVKKSERIPMSDMEMKLLAYFFAEKSRICKEKIKEKMKTTNVQIITENDKSWQNVELKCPKCGKDIILNGEDKYICSNNECDMKPGVVWKYKLKKDELQHLLNNESIEIGVEYGKTYKVFPDYQYGEKPYENCCFWKKTEIKT